MGDARVSAGTCVGVAGGHHHRAITAVIPGFLVPAQNDAASILRLFMMMLAAALGWYGISMGFLAILMHLGSLTSFGVPYFDGFSWTSNLQDAVVRMPLWSMVRRPISIARGDMTRRRFFIPPLRVEGRGTRKGWIRVLMAALRWTDSPRQRIAKSRGPKPPRQRRSRAATTAPRIFQVFSRAG
jgi:hypothetical protein